MGNSSVSSIRCQVQTISSLSDVRDKENIEELPLGIEFINTLRPVKFDWAMRDGANKGVQEIGFVAQ
ncbi:MAG TPA: tail fiber domain-containing protein, partial [Alphaproteobacteria bacterium]|nr:tail fiber domain-containing protein [Alphaproteobacteria bacterium]